MTFTSTTIFEICVGKASSGGQQCYILKTNLELPYLNSYMLSNICIYIYIYMYIYIYIYILTKAACCRNIEIVLHPTILSHI